MSDEERNEDAEEFQTDRFFKEVRYVLTGVGRMAASGTPIPDYFRQHLTLLLSMVLDLRAVIDDSTPRDVLERELRGQSALGDEAFEAIRAAWAYVGEMDNEIKALYQLLDERAEAAAARDSDDQA